MAEHTPGELAVGRDAAGHALNVLTLDDLDDDVVCRFRDDQPRRDADAARIVAAWNHLDALVAVVEALAADLTAACDLASPAREEVWRRDIAEARRVLDAVRDGGGSTPCDD